MAGILLAVDLQPASVAAAARARLVTDATGARLSALHISDGDDLAEAESFGREQGLEMTVLPGEPAATILQIAQSEQPDLVVVGAHRARFFRDLTTTALAEKLLAELHCPLLVVTGPPAAGYVRAVVGVNPEAGPPEHLEAARRFAPQAAVVAVHAFHLVMGDRYADLEAAEQREQEVALQRYLDGHGAKVDAALVLDGGPAQVLQNAARDRKADLVVLGAPSHLGLAGRILGSAVTDLLADPPCDVLIVP